MKNILFYSFVVLLVFTLFSCNKSEKSKYLPSGAGLYNVVSDKSESTELINKYEIKYICLSDGYMCTDLFRKDGVYGYNIAINNGEFSYKPLNKRDADELHLKPDFNWWNRNGGWLAIILGICIILLKILDFAAGD